MTPAHWGIQWGFKLEHTVANAVQTWLPRADIRRHWSNATKKVNLCKASAGCIMNKGFKQNRPYEFRDWKSSITWVQRQLIT